MVKQFNQILWISCLLSVCEVQAQDNYMDDIMGVVFLDSVTVTAVRGGFRVEDFVRLVREDTSFYLAFKNLRRARYTSENKMTFYGKKHKVKAAYWARTVQEAWGNCRAMEVVNERVEGNYLDRGGDRRYITASLFHYLFWTKDTVCSKFFSPFDSIYTTAMERYKAQLKTMVFSPGKPVKGVPFVGKKMAIFARENAWVYDYSIRSEQYKQQDCYVFSVKVSDSVKVSERDAVISEMVTYFNKKDFRIVARRMHLSFATLLFDFDVKMEIDIQAIREHNIVERVSYNGYWDIPFRKPEIARFEVTFDVEDIVE